MSELNIKTATEMDVPLLLQFIKDIAEYERLSHAVVATEEMLYESLFGSERVAEAIIAYHENNPVAFAIFFHNFSTFVGRRGLYLEDLFVKPEYRGRGFGRAMLIHLAKLAKERNCGRFEWSVLDWNESAIKFYKSLGATPMDEWTVFRLDEKPLDKLAQENGD